MGLVGNNSMGLADFPPDFPPDYLAEVPPEFLARIPQGGRRVQAIAGGSGVPVIGAAIRLVDGAGRPVPGVTVGFTGGRGAFLLQGVPLGTRAVVDAAWAVGGAGRVELAIVRPVESRTAVLVDAPSSLAGAWALEQGGGRLDGLDPEEVAAAAAVLRQHPEALACVDLGSRAALAAAFGRVSPPKATPAPGPTSTAGPSPSPSPGQTPRPEPPEAPSPGPSTDLTPSPSPRSTPLSGDPTGDPTPIGGPTGDPTPIGGPTGEPDDRFDMPLGPEPDAGLFPPSPGSTPMGGSH